MYAADPAAKYRGALAAGVPGELAGLHAAWSRYGRLPWRDLVAPAIRLARDGYEVVPYLARALQECEGDVLADPGLRAVFAPGGRRVLAAGETCRNPALAAALERVAEEGAAALYGGAVGEALVRDVRAAGGVMTVDDLRGYRVDVGAALRADAMGFTFLGMPPPSSGTLGMALVSACFAPALQGVRSKRKRRALICSFLGIICTMTNADPEHPARVQLARVLEGAPGHPPGHRVHQAHASHPDGPRRPRLRGRDRRRRRDAVDDIRRQSPAEDRGQHDLPSRLLLPQVRMPNLRCGFYRLQPCRLAASGHRSFLFWLLAAMASGGASWTTTAPATCAWWTVTGTRWR